MRVVTIILIVVALAVAGATAFFVNQFLNQTEAQAQKPPEVIEEPKVEVLVAATDLDVGKILRSEDLRWQEWPESSVNPDYVVRGTGRQDKADSKDELADITGSAVRVKIVTGEPILSSKLFHRGDAGFLAGVLTPGMRAVTVAVNPETGAGGFVMPGDRVDLVVNFNVLDKDPLTGDQTNRIVSETILQNLRVLAIDQNVAPKDSSTASDKGSDTVANLVDTVTLEVTPNQSQAVAVADQLGRIRLVLRSAIDGQISETPVRYSPDYAVSAFLGRRIPDSARVLVARADIAPGTVLTDRDWVWQDFPAAKIQRNWVREGSVDLNTLRSALTQGTIAAGTPIVPENLILPGDDDYIATLLKPGMRAITVPLDEIARGLGLHLARRLRRRAVQLRGQGQVPGRADQGSAPLRGNPARGRPGAPHRPPLRPRHGPAGDDLGHADRHPGGDAGERREGPARPAGGRRQPDPARQRPGHR